MATVQQMPPTGTIGDKPADPYKAENTENEVPIKEKMEGLLAFMDRCRYGMMTTRDTTSGLLASRCMELAATVCPPPPPHPHPSMWPHQRKEQRLTRPQESNGTDLLFFTNTHTHKVDELAHDPHVNLSFVSPVGEWASVAGSASVVTDRSLVRAHYTPTLKAWLGDLGDGRHDGSAEDPRLGMIRVRMQTAACSLSGKGVFGTVKDVVAGAVSGKVASVVKLREISEKEVELWRTTEMQ